MRPSSRPTQQLPRPSHAHYAYAYAYIVPHPRARPATPGNPQPHSRGPLCTRRSNNNIYAQIIDDSKGLVLVSASTKEKGMEAATANGGNCNGATEVGKRLGARALEKGVDKVHFDRNGRLYHGRVKSVAEGAREAGLAF
eukprot:scaffold42690_cov60-Phaeocystis_antarctica.AAC.2